MATISRRQLLGFAGRAAAAGVLLQVPSVLYEDRWVRAAQAQTPPTVSADFVALVAAVNGVADDDEGVDDIAAWIVAEFDKALPPLPRGAPSAAVAAILDAYTVRTGRGVTFSSASTEGRHAALEAMVKDPDPSIQQVANQVLPFAAFAYWSDVVLGEPAQPGGPRPPQWDVAGYLGPSHDRSDSYRDGSPPGFSPRRDFER
ncbi:MAG: hypothetical protein ACRDUY_08350 [Nitriliruptorales bacterium]